MSRRAINNARSAENPHWRNPTHGVGAPAMVEKSPDERAAEARLRLEDENANLRRENEMLRRQVDELRQNAPPRDPTPQEILDAVASAIATRREVASLEEITLAAPPRNDPAPPATSTARPRAGRIGRKRQQ